MIAVADTSPLSYLVLIGHSAVPAPGLRVNPPSGSTLPSVLGTSTSGPDEEENRVRPARLAVARDLLLEASYLTEIADECQWRQ